MKKQTGVWIDSTKAIVVDLEDQKEIITEISGHIENRIHHDDEGDKGSFMGSRHINNEKKFEERKKHQIDNYLGLVLEVLHHADEIYVFGPSHMKLKLKERIEANKQLASKLHSVESADSMTNNQIVAQVKKIFKTK